MKMTGERMDKIAEKIDERLDSIRKMSNEERELIGKDAYAAFKPVIDIHCHTNEEVFCAGFILGMKMEKARHVNEALNLLRAFRKLKQEGE